MNRLIRMAILAVVLAPISLAQAQPIPIDISGSTFEIRSANTLRLRNVSVTGYPGKYFADIQWNAGSLVFVPIAAGQETTPPFYDKTLLLKGKWHFVYTIITTFTNDYTLTTIPGTTNSQGGYFINGTGQFGNIVVASYFPADGNWSLLDPGTIIDRFYQFQTDGNTILPPSCYYQISHPSGSFSNCYVLSGSKTGPADTGTDVDADGAIAGQLAEAGEARLMPPADAAPPSMAVIERYWIMKGLMNLR